MTINRFFAVAPMMKYTDRHARYLFRLISKNVLLYTEMVTTGALIHGDFKRFLAYNIEEHPIALQLGGNSPKDLAFCAKLGESYGYDEVNLNVGCPSDRVKSGQFGACLMLNPILVRDCISAMIDAVQIPITIKCRIGVDQIDAYDDLSQFIQSLSQAGCQVFIIHARKAWLNGLSPKQNRDIPPLRYDIVKNIKRDFPQLTIILNGGIKTLADIQTHQNGIDGVMIGREAYANPLILSQIENKYFDTPLKNSFDIIENFIPYIQKELTVKTKLTNMTRHLFGLFQNQKGAKVWRRYLSENAYKNSTINLLHQALAVVQSFENE